MAEAVGIHLQLPEAAGLWPSGDSYRQGFRDWVEHHALPADRVVLVEPSPIRLAALRAMWASHPGVEFRQAEVVADQDDPGQALLFAVEDAKCPIESTDPETVLAYMPNGHLVSQPIPSVGVAALLREMSAGARIRMLAMDLREEGQGLIEEIDWSSPSIERISMQLEGIDPAHRRAVEGRLRSAGLRPAGRAWGEAGTTAQYVRALTPAARLDAWLAQAKVTLGAAIVSIRAAWPNAHRRAALRDRLRYAITADRRRAEVLDHRYGEPLSIVDRHWVRRRAADVRATVKGTLDLRPDWEDPRELAGQCHERHGLWPISFSYPGRLLEARPVRDRLISPVIPGYPYSFDDHAQYMESYASAWYGATHHKAGWDCFRHVEILAAGSIPWMLDVDLIPGFSMVHYPKAAMSAVSHALAANPGTPDPALVQGFAVHLRQHLTSIAVASYLLQSARLQDAERILFVDAQHPAISDYQSTLTLIGLKQLRGPSIEPMFPAPWIYEDFQATTAHLYGRGFGYARSVPAHARTERESAAARRPDRDLRGLDPGGFDALVIGSISRNSDLARRLLNEVPARATVWIHGEDLPPTKAEAAYFRQAGVSTFVRSIHRSP